MRLVPVTFLGSTAINRRFSAAMIPWLVMEIKRANFMQNVSLGVDNGILQVYNANFELEFEHIVANTTLFKEADTKSKTFLYFLKDDYNDQLLQCFLFLANKCSDVTILYALMRQEPAIVTSNSGSSGGSSPIENGRRDENDNPDDGQRQLKRSPSAVASGMLTSGNGSVITNTIQTSSSNFYEVLYVGKIKVSHRNVPDTFVDDALVKLREKAHASNEIKNLSCSQSYQKIGGGDDHVRVTDKENGRQLTKSLSVHTFDGNGKLLSSPSDDNNRTMVLQVGRTDLRLISLDRKSVLLHKLHKDVVSCIGGVTNVTYFGFVCREFNGTTSFVAFILKCESQSIATEIVQALKKAYANSLLNNGLSSCETCPMVWYHRLCHEIEPFNDRKTLQTILKRIEQALDATDQEPIMAVLRGKTFESACAQSELLMSALRAYCEQKQLSHAHDPHEARSSSSDFLNQYFSSGGASSGSSSDGAGGGGNGNGGAGNTIFMKARRSLSNSFDNLLKRRVSKDEGNNNQQNQQNLNLITLSANNTDQLTSSETTRATMATTTHQLQMHENKQKSPMMDIFLKVGTNAKMTGVVSSGQSSDDQLDKLDSGDEASESSWRQAILRSVRNRNDSFESLRHRCSERTRADLRDLWTKSIVLVMKSIRIEKENARIRVKQEESVLRQLKLDYDDLSAPSNVYSHVWDALETNGSAGEQITNAIRYGVPKMMRAHVWQYLAKQFENKAPPIEQTYSNLTAEFVNYNESYDKLARQLTAHQHAILIDLGRTFPSHLYFAAAFGPGQLSLFNLLKAYSLVDPEVGYCQGLSFIAGLLLLHVDESTAFSLMKHLMFRRQLRQQYLPDMEALQVQLYQLSRLLRDRLPQLHRIFDNFEVFPSLYAAPWMLTIFASQFPLGFVARVFDSMFLEGQSIIIKVSLALLDQHGDELLKCQSFEEIMTYLKETMPSSIDRKSLANLMKRVQAMDISTQLNEYRVEYFVLQEEMALMQPKLDALRKSEKQNDLLVKENRNLSAQLEMALAAAQRLEKSLAMQQAVLHKVDTDAKCTETNLNAIAAVVNDLLAKKLIDRSLIDDRVMSIIAEQASENRSKPPRPPTTHYLIKSVSLNKIEPPVIAGATAAVKSIDNRRNSLLSDSDTDVKLQRLAKHLIRSPFPTAGAPIRVIEDDMVYEPLQIMRKSPASSAASSTTTNGLQKQQQQQQFGKISKSASLPLTAASKSTTVIVEEENDTDSGISTPTTLSNRSVSSGSGGGGVGASSNNHHPLNNVNDIRWN